MEVIPLGRVNQTALAVVAAHLQAFFSLNSLVTEPRPEPDYALIPARGQYDAYAILQQLSQANGPRPISLGVVSVDLCLPFLSHVFGEALMGSQAAIISLHRLMLQENGAPAPRDLCLERLAKVALHEVAHLLGLSHCEQVRCLMRFSESLTSLDRVGLSLCRRCERLLNTARKRLFPPNRDLRLP
ncbi:MAG: hypothetical protein PVG03_11100 [Desulfarculaceae bacterium]